jgi:ribonuclease H2 subunit C
MGESNADDGWSVGQHKTAYFRGRKLCGRGVAVPRGYKGVVCVKTEEVGHRLGEGDGDGEDDEEEAEEEVKVMEEVAEFKEVWVWGHEMLVDDGDAYVKSLEEWVGVAEAVSSALANSLWRGANDDRSFRLRIVEVMLRAR